MRIRILGFLACASICPAQWQLGGAAGYGIYRNATIFSPDGKATAGIRNRFAVSAFLTEDMYEYIGGELRYTYQDGDPFIQAGRLKSNLQGQSHAFHYDALFHTRPRGDKVRPYVAVGVGAKLFVVTGPPNPSQPLSKIGLLTTNDEARPLFTAGGGVKWRWRENVILRIDFRDYVTPFPKKLIAPARLGTARGILHQFTPLFGVSYSF